MHTDEVMIIARNNIILVLYLSMPAIAAATAVGLIVALIQTLIQVQEQTLSFTVKLMTIAAVFALSGAWMINEMLASLTQALSRISGL